MEFHFVIEEYNRIKEWCKNNRKHDPICDKSLAEWLDNQESIEEFEQRVMLWSKQNPRPKYPTIGDLINKILDYSSDGNLKYMAIEDILSQEIPERAAHRYNIEPLTTYESEWR